MVINVDKMEAVIENPHILITDQHITNIKDILPILETVSQEGRGLLIISDDIGNEIVGTLVANKMRGTLNVVCVKPPKFGENREAWLEDIAIVTGGKFISQKLGIELKTVTMQDLGSAKTVKVDKDSTTIVGGNGSSFLIEERVKALKAQIDRTATDFEKEKLKERLAKMTSGVAVIRVGANTETELADKKLRLEDALAATRAAIGEGIVAGGGVALLSASDVLEEIKSNYSGYVRTGIEIVQNAIQYPIKRIVENAGYEGAVVINEIRRINKQNYGFDVYEEKYVDMIEHGIIDPAKVTRTALQNALSITGLILTTEVLVANDKDKKDTNNGNY